MPKRMMWVDTSPGVVLADAVDRPGSKRAFGHGADGIAEHAHLEEPGLAEYIVAGVALATAIGVGAGAARLSGWWRARRERLAAETEAGARQAPHLHLVDPESQRDAA